MHIAELAKGQEGYIVGLRRYFHTHPELTGKEFHTLKKIKEELEAMGIPYVEIPEGGIIATLEGKTEGKAVLLRADVDALAIREAEENLCRKRVCISGNTGVMHACGHDGHIAMLLGAAKILLEKKEELNGRVYLCFERGEEGGGNIRYLLEYLEKEQVHIDSVYAAHLYAGVESGKIAVNDGAMMASNLPFHVTIRGKGGHGSRPDRACNPIDAFVEIYSRMGNLRMTKIDPFTPLTFSIGEVTAGNCQNVIPEELTFKGTMRTFDREGAGMTFYHEFKKLIDSVCAFHGCEAVYTRYNLPGFPVINDRACAALARQAMGETLGADCLTEAEPWMASESFAKFLHRWPGVFAFIGIRNEEKGVGAEHHSPAFDIDEDVLWQGSAAAASYALAFLKGEGYAER